MIYDLLVVGPTLRAAREYSRAMPGRKAYASPEQWLGSVRAKRVIWVEGWAPPARIKAEAAAIEFLGALTPDPNED